jgi:hypothetical protein
MLKYTLRLLLFGLLLALSCSAQRIGRYFNIADLYLLGNPRWLEANRQRAAVLKEMF